MRLSGIIRYAWGKVCTNIDYRKNAIWRYLPVNTISLWGCGRPFTKYDFKEKLTLLLGPLDPVLLNLSGDEKNIVISHADAALSHYYDILGSGLVLMERINWHLDIKSKYEWRKGVYFRDQRKSNPKGSDIKVPWEISRCHHFLWLGEAYIITKDDKYAKEIVDEINDWIDDNPLMYTVNWVCAMDVAIRAVNWMYALNMIASSPSITEEFVIRVYHSLFQHGFFIWNNQEKTIPWSNNHYTSDLVGLIFLGALFNQTWSGKKWKKHASKELFSETRKQVLPSGVHYEKSISYHRLMVELTTYPLALLRRAGETIPEDIIRLTQKMYDYVGMYLKPNGTAPLLADNDDGRLLPFMPRPFLQHGYLYDNNSLENKIVNCGITPLFKENHFQQSKEYEDAGIAIIKNYGCYLMVSNNGYSRRPEDNKMFFGTHTHNDLLSFDFSIGEDDIFVDTGAYLYTSSIAERNRFRSTKKHNTIMIDEEEQNILSEKNAFSIKRNNKDRKIHLLNNNECRGSYETISGEMKHHRTFKLFEGEMEIFDEIEKCGVSHTGVFYLHLSPSVKVNMNANSEIILQSEHYEITINNNADNILGELQTTLEKDDYSPSYGVLLKSKCIATKFTFGCECKMKTIIKWRKKL